MYPRVLIVVAAAILLAGCSSTPTEAKESQGETPSTSSRKARELAPFTVLVMGDNRGEIEPCGCKDYPRGGLARRATFVEGARKEGPVLLLDAGDALFEDAYRRSEYGEAKAELIIDAMAKMRTAAMAVGDRDLTNGLEWLVSRAEAAGLPLLSSNLRTEDGKKIFPGHRLFHVGEARVGVFAVFGQRDGARAPAKLVVEDPEAAARGEIEALRREGADVILGLVHGPSKVVRAVAQLEGVDMVVPSHDGSISLPYRPRPEAAWIVAGGQMGRTLTTIRLSLEGEGPLVDVGAVAQLEDEQRDVQRNLMVARARFEQARQGSAEREAFAEQLRRLEERDAELGHRIAASSKVKGRRFEADQRNLGDDVPDHPEFAAMRSAFDEANPEPPPTAAAQR